MASRVPPSPFQVLDPPLLVHEESLTPVDAKESLAGANRLGIAYVRK